MSDTRDRPSRSAACRLPRDVAADDKRITILAWAAGLGAVTAEALAHRDGISLAAARGRLQAAVAASMLTATRPLRANPALYTLTSVGMKAIGDRGLDSCRVSPRNAQHLIACAAVAAALERRYPQYAVAGERELRREEREHGDRLASAALGGGHAGKPLLHRPDLVLWPRSPSASALPLAVEVELTVKAQRRLQGICRAWGRCELVAGVLYLVAPPVQRPLARAIERAQAHPHVLSLPLACLDGPIGKAIPSDA